MNNLKEAERSFEAIPLRLLEAEAPRFKKKSAHEGGKVVSPTHRPPLPPGNIPATHFC
jgi:hypothetical protein